MQAPLAGNKGIGISTHRSRYCHQWPDLCIQSKKWIERHAILRHADGKVSALRPPHGCHEILRRARSFLPVRIAGGSRKPAKCGRQVGVVLGGFPRYALRCRLVTELAARETT